MSADFFQPGHTYADADGYDWRFRVDTITTHPENGELTALGWRFFNGQWEPYAYAEDDWDVHQAVGHTDITVEPGATPGPTGRVAQLLDAIRTTQGRWTTTRAAQFYRDSHIEPPEAQWARTRTVARGDLRDLAAWGHLLRHEEPGRQYFTLKTRKDGRS